MANRKYDSDDPAERMRMAKKAYYRRKMQDPVYKEQRTKRQQERYKLIDSETRERYQMARREYYAQNRERIRVRYAAWYAENGRTRSIPMEQREAIRAAIREWQRKNPEKKAAHKAVALAIKEGRLKNPGRCSECNRDTTYLDAHHDDYSRPLQIRWLCISCHRRLHFSARRSAENGKKGGRPSTLA